MLQYLMLGGNEQNHAKETKKEKLERCQMNMVSLELVENCGFTQERMNSSNTGS